MPCPCLSGKKFKKCCLPTLPMAVSENEAKHHLEQMSKPDLVFMTADNQDRLKELMANRAKEKSDGQ